VEIEMKLDERAAIANRPVRAGGRGGRKVAETGSAASAFTRHRIPVIDRMVDVLFALEQRAEGASIRDLVEYLKLPRTSLYRILNTLQFHEIVRRTSDSAYRLGPRLVALAARAVDDNDLAAIAAPHLRRLSAETGEGCKLSIVDGDGILVVAAADGKRDYALTVSAGQRLPLHAGAASKVLMAHLSGKELVERLARPLPRYTAKTLIDKRRLMAELTKVRRQGWAQDKGEFLPSIQAFGAPIPDANGKVVAAVSVPFLTGATSAQMEIVRVATVAAAKAIAAVLRRPGRL
jgi:DNA-binding IclR family transcriptional regulator